MKREFVEVEIFTKTWSAMGLTDDDLAELQNTLLENPTSGRVIKGTGGARKSRFAFEGRGKSRSGRVIYVDFFVSERLYLIMSYPKNKQATLTDKQKSQVRKLIDEIRKEEQKRGK